MVPLLDCSSCACSSERPTGHRLQPRPRSQFAQPLESFCLRQNTKEASLDLFEGLVYNLRGLRLGLRKGKLLFWGLTRFVLVLLILLVLSGVILSYQQEMMELIWIKPESRVGRVVVVFGFMAHIPFASGCCSLHLFSAVSTPLQRRHHGPHV